MPHASNVPPTPGPSPVPAAGRVVGVFTAPRAGAPVEAHARALLVAGQGIAGDRYALGRGHWSDPRWPDQEVTLIEAEVADALGLAPERLRRNIVTRGVALASLLGRRVRIGEALIEGVRPCDPCGYLDTLTRPGVAEALRDGGGLRARILTGGWVARGDLLVVAEAPP